ncbi:uncharacterized protein LOC127136083 [Lathyrus oleraceus]|uniref:uncharacterized protein LOC127136083 n=1 Tax=Pisum sativum TaxID=3888 RepID=UPI0021CF994E|nr:uncharacterized protein LOC127136083 [Pisum sativum]
MSQHPSSSGSKSSQHAKTSSMEFVDEDVMNVTPLCMIPGDTTGTSSNAGDKQGNTSGNSSLPKDMYYTDRAIRRLVTRILSEGHKVEGVSTPLSRREPSPEEEPHADKDDDSSRSEKEVAAEGLCSLGKTLPSKKQNVPQENIIDLEEESTEGEDEPLVHLVKPSVAEKLRTKKGKSMAKMRAAKVKKTAGIGPSKPWSKVEVGKRKERDNSDSEEDVKDDRRVAIERELGQEAVEVKEVIELIKNAGLMKTVVTLPQCYEGLVKEFIVNIPEDIHDKNSREFCKLPIAFPSLMCGIILSQQPDILNTNDMPSRRKTPLSINYKLFEGSHINDVVMTSVRREPTSQGSLIDQLKDTYKELEKGMKVAKARKEALEALIYNLEKEELEKDGKA